MNTWNAVYLLLHFVSSRQEKETEYANWVACINWTVNNMSWEERESRHRPWIFLLVIYCSLSILAGLFHFHKFVSGVRPLIRAHSENGACEFLSVLTSSWLVFNSYLPLCVWLLIHFQTRVVSFTSNWYQKEDISISSGFTLAQKIWDFCFFIVFLNYCSHSLVIG